MKNLKIISTFILSFFLIAEVVSCSVNKSGTKNMDFTVIDSGNYSGVSEKTEEIIDNPEKYTELFSAIHQNEYPISFPEYSKDKSYIFLTFGQKNSGGLDYSVEKIFSNNGLITVQLKSLVSKDGEISMGTMAISAPYIVLEIPKTNLKKITVITK